MKTVAGTEKTPIIVYREGRAFATRWRVRYGSISPETTSNDLFGTYAAGRTSSFA